MHPEYSMRARVGLLLGPFLFVLMLVLPPPAGMSQGAWRVAAGVLMAAWWVTEAIPIPATALLPLLLFPLLGVAPVTEAAAPYANPVIFLFMGGFIIAMALEVCGLHRRMALAIIRAVGTQPVRLIAGFMVATALLSMWVSNTATVVMMLPMALSVIQMMERQASPDSALDPNFATALLLGLAYGASIGGLGILIGTPPNALLVRFMNETYGVQIGFGEWMLVGVPLVLVLLPACWLLLTRVLFPLRGSQISGGEAAIQEEIRTLGPLSRAEVIVGTITALTAGAWIFQPLIAKSFTGVSDAVIAIAGALLLFLVPVNWRRGEFPLRWEQAERLPWAVLILFGGGLSLANAVQETGLAEWIGQAFSGVSAWSVVLVVIIVTTVVVFLTELTSNTATAAAFLPVVAAHPLLLTVPTAIAASCAFMMPVATPPNAIVYGSGRITNPQMARAGLTLNVISVVVITAAVFGLVPYILPVTPAR